MSVFLYALRGDTRPGYISEGGGGGGRGGGLNAEKQTFCVRAASSMTASQEEDMYSLQLCLTGSIWKAT